jgi:hypothetical protein
MQAYIEHHRRFGKLRRDEEAETPTSVFNFRLLVQLFTTAVKDSRYNNVRGASMSHQFAHGSKPFYGYKKHVLAISSQILCGWYRNFAHKGRLSVAYECQVALADFHNVDAYTRRFQIVRNLGH